MRHNVCTKCLRDRVRNKYLIQTMCYSWQMLECITVKSYGSWYSGWAYSLLPELARVGSVREVNLTDKNGRGLKQINGSQYVTRKEAPGANILLPFVNSFFTSEDNSVLIEIEGKKWTAWFGEKNRYFDFLQTTMSSDKMNDELC